MSRHDTWASYLDPEDTEARPPEAERAALDRIRGVLADPATWSEPPDDLTTRVLALAAFETTDEPPTDTDAAPDEDARAPGPAAPNRAQADSPHLIAPSFTGTGTDPTATDVAAETSPGLTDAGVTGAGEPGAKATGAGATVAGETVAGEIGVDGVRADRIDADGTVGADGRGALETGAGAVEETAPVVPLAPRRRRRWLVAAASGIAAAVAAVLAISFWPGSSPTQYPVAGTAVEPAATATVTVDPRPAGVAITVRIKGLPPSTDDTYYAVWLRGDSGTVPVGSFHWRKSGEPIDLWSGVDPSRYPTFFITRQHEGAPPTPSTETVLQGALT